MKSPAEEELEFDKPLEVLGRDVTKIPCFRNSILYGVGSGIGSGLLVFLCTSKPRWGSHAAVGTFVCVNLGYWFKCRHRYAIQKFGMGQIQGAYQKALILDGTQKQKMQTSVEVVDV